MSFTIDLVHNLEDQLRDAAKRAGVDPNTYAASILAHHLHKQNNVVSETEATLLQQINLGLPVETWQRYNQLRAKLENETLLANEQQMLLDITDQLEAANAKRIEALIKLAKIRNTTLDLLMDELGLKPPTHA